DKALIHGAGGGVGLAALDICRILGVETLGTASAHKHEFLKERGLDVVIDHRQDFGRVVNDVTNGRGVQLILDPVGGPLWQKNYRLLAPAGRLICYGMSSSVGGKKRSWWHMFRAAVNLRFYTPTRLMSDNKGVLGVNLGHLWDYGDEVRRWMAQIMSWYDEALFRPHIDRTFPLAEAAAAHDFIQERQNVGKVLLIP
ncbi:MAG: zinc-binding dehydrogenase, partial [Anaerolineae bacterium]